MNPREVVRAAALLATQHAYPPLPVSLVQWSDEAQSQPEGDFPHVTMTTVSEVPEGPVSLRKRVNIAGELSVRMLQTYIWTVQFKCEGFKLDSTELNNPTLFARKMRFGWYLQATEAALLDLGTDEAERNPVKMVDQVGQILTLNKSSKGHTLPILVYEIEFRYVDHDEDPTPVGVIETVTLAGRIEGGGGAEGGDSTPGGAGVDIIITTEGMSP